MDTRGPASTPPAREVVYLTPMQVHERWPFLSVGNLAQMRFTGRGPRFLKPTPRTVVYRERDILAFIEASERTSTAVVA